MAHAPGSIRARLQNDTDHAWRLYCALELLIPHRDPSPNDQVKISRQPAVASTIPWNGTAAGLVMELHAEVRRIEMHLRETNFGVLSQRRGGSKENTRFALSSISVLTDPVDDQTALGVLIVIDRWIHKATAYLTPEKGLHRLPREPGASETRCPYCDNRTMRWHPASGIVVCINPECVNEADIRPRWQADFTIDDGELQMVWKPMGAAA